MKLKLNRNKNVNKTVALVSFIILVISAIIGAYLTTRSQDLDTRPSASVSCDNENVKVLNHDDLANPHVDGSLYYDHRVYRDTDESPLPACGLIMYYREGLMEKVWDYRHNKEGYPECDDCVGYAALMRDGDKKRKVCVQRPGHEYIEGPFYVIDVAANKDKADLVEKKWLIDVGFKTARKWDMVNADGSGGHPIPGNVIECPEGHKPYIVGDAVPTNQFSKSRLNLPQNVVGNDLNLTWTKGSNVDYRYLYVASAIGNGDIYSDYVSSSDTYTYDLSNLVKGRGKVHAILYSYNSSTKKWELDGPHAISYDINFDTNDFVKSDIDLAAVNGTVTDTFKVRWTEGNLVSLNYPIVYVISNSGVSTTLYSGVSYDNELDLSLKNSKIEGSGKVYVYLWSYNSSKQVWGLSGYETLEYSVN